MYKIGDIVEAIVPPEPDKWSHVLKIEGITPKGTWITSHIAYSSTRGYAEFPEESMDRGEMSEKQLIESHYTKSVMTANQFQALFNIWYKPPQSDFASIS